MTTSPFSEFTAVTEVPGEGPEWVPIDPARHIEFEGTAAELAAALIAGDPARGGQWRALVWEGREADLTTAPAAECYAR